MARKTLVGEKIVSLRKALGLTQADLGEKVGVSRVAITQYELGDTLPSPTTLAKLSQVLSFDLAEIWQASPNPSTAADEYRGLPFFPVGAYPSLVSFVDPAQRGAYHTVLARVPVLILPGVDYERAAVVEIQGDGMMPRYPPGARYLIHPVMEELRFALGVHLFLFRDKRPQFRRITSNKAGTMTLRQDATGEEMDLDIRELEQLQRKGALMVRRLGQAVYLPPEM